MDEAVSPPRTGAKRGRRPEPVDPAGGPVAAFALALAELKVAAGDPSYARMRTELGALCSTSALSAAARGRDLPSWETTWEFVRCLAPAGSDLETLERTWRTRWETALAGTAPATPERRVHRRRWLMAGSTLAVLAGTGVALALVRADPEPEPRPVPSLVPGDRSRFVDDVTVDDGTVVRTNETFLKVWEIRNAGSVPWTGRYLQRLPGPETGGCRTPDRVPVPATAPGTSVRIGVDVQASATPGRCLTKWAMVDDAGREFFPALRPVYFEVVVAP